MNIYDKLQKLSVSDTSLDAHLLRCTARAWENILKDHWKVQNRASIDTVTEGILNCYPDLRVYEKRHIRELVRQMSHVYVDAEGDKGEEKRSVTTTGVEEKRSVTTTSVAAFLVNNGCHWQGEPSAQYDFLRLVTKVLKKKNENGYSPSPAYDLYRDGETELSFAEVFGAANLKVQQLAALKEGYSKLQRYHEFVLDGNACWSPVNDRHLAFMVRLEKLFFQAEGKSLGDSQEAWAQWQKKFGTLGIEEHVEFEINTFKEFKINAKRRSTKRECRMPDGPTAEDLVEIIRGLGGEECAESSGV